MQQLRDKQYMIQIKVQIMAPRPVAVRITQFAAAQHLRRAHLQRVCGRKRTKLIIVHIRFVVHPQCPTTRGPSQTKELHYQRTRDNSHSSWERRLLIEREDDHWHALSK